jgi:DNA-binding transcriptional ArsR family regulator
MAKSIPIPARLAPKKLDKLRPEFFKALGDPVRLAIVAHMAQQGEPSTVTAVSGCCGIDFSGVSRHLKILREAGIVKAEKRGRETFYSLQTGKITKTLRGLSDILERMAK